MFLDLWFFPIIVLENLYLYLSKIDFLENNLIFLKRSDIFQKCYFAK